MDFQSFLHLLPIRSVLPELRRTLAVHSRAVLAAPPGSGKTTGLPLALLTEEWLQGRTILMLEPRRLAARTAAGYMASLLGEPVGETVGYRIRFEQAVSARTRLEVLTEGLLCRRLQQDPALERAGLVIFDEFHERSLAADLALALTLDSQAGLREDLRVLIMSATLEVDKTAARLQAPVITGGGRQYPVTVEYLPGDPAGGLAETAASGIRRAWTEQAGDLLAFLPGVREIRQTSELLASWAASQNLRILPLFGDLPSAEQQQALQADPQGRRRLVLATAVAETSLTLDGISTVVDAGWSRVPRFDPNSGLTRLETSRVSKAAAEQRAGRAGRQGPGTCYRLWSEHTHRGLVAQLPPEILQADLAGLVLELAQWGVTEPEALVWLDAPPPGPLAQARALLQTLGGLDDRHRITPWGRELVRLPLHPRLASMLLHGAALGAVDLACDLAALLEERDIVSGADPGRSTDLEERLRLVALFRSAGVEPIRRAGGEPQRCRQVVRAARQYRRLLASGPGEARCCSPGALLAFAYPDRICRLRPQDRHQYLLANGRGVFLPAGDLQAGSELLVAARLDAGQARGRIFLAAPLPLEEVRAFHAHLLQEASSLHWEEEPGRVVARQEERLAGLVLTSRPVPLPPEEELLPAFLGALQLRASRMLPWSREARELQARVLSLRHWLPGGEWPDWSDEQLWATLEEWLAPWVLGMSSLAQLQRLDLAVVLRGRLDWSQQQRLEEGAPTHWRVPSGSRCRLVYAPGGPPVLAVRLQEMFGLTETPRVCWDRVPVLLHLLSPARRPVQITQDLAGFWQHSYAQVKRELQGRYPKHYWPDDPLAAPATARTKPRG